MFSLAKKIFLLPFLFFLLFLSSCEQEGRQLLKFRFPSVKDGIYTIKEGGTPYKSLTEFNTSIYVDSMPAIPASSFLEIYKSKSEYTNGWELIIRLNDKATHEFAELTQSNMGKKLPIIFYNQLIMEPIVGGVITTGSLVISPFNEELLDMIFVPANTKN